MMINDVPQTQSLRDEPKVELLVEVSLWTTLQLGLPGPLATLVNVIFHFKLSKATKA
jgi:hypothetical protein